MTVLRKIKTLNLEIQAEDFLEKELNIPREVAQKYTLNNRIISQLSYELADERFDILIKPLKNLLLGYAVVKIIDITESNEIDKLGLRRLIKIIEEAVALRIEASPISSTVHSRFYWFLNRHSAVYGVGLSREQHDREYHKLKHRISMKTDLFYRQLYLEAEKEQKNDTRRQEQERCQSQENDKLRQLKVEKAQKKETLKQAEIDLRVRKQQEFYEQFGRYPDELSFGQKIALIALCVILILVGMIMAWFS